LRVSGHFRPRTLWLQDISALVSKVSYGHFGTKEDTLAPGNRGPSHGQADGCACVITQIRLIITGSTLVLTRCMDQWKIPIFDPIWGA